MEIRPAVFAGSWYPSRAEACKKEIRQFLAARKDDALAAKPWLGGIVPHAGWYYSGEIACRVINLLKGADPIDLVVVFGMHLHPRSANVLMPSGAWQTPFGPLEVDAELAEHLCRQFDFQLETSGRFSQDNTVEVQLPFIKHLLAPAKFLAVGVPPAAASLGIGEAVARWAREQGKQIRVIGSTDLTHYGDNYGFRPKGRGPAAVAWVREHNDRRMVDAIVALSPLRVLEEAGGSQNACCAGAVATAIAAAKQLGTTRARTVAYATSQEKSPGDSFVGYAGVVFGIEQA